MPRKKPGHTMVTIEFPDDVLELVRQAAKESKFRKLTPWVVAACAKKVRVEFEPAPLGQPPKNKGEN